MAFYKPKGRNMKKLVLTSLFAVFAVSAANAANVIDNNPLYRPDAGRFYSVTTLGTHSEADLKAWSLGEEFGYGITEKLAFIMGSSFSMHDTFDHNSWDNFSLGMNYRFLNDSRWKADLFGKYDFGGISLPFISGGAVWGDHAKFLDKDRTFYTWTAGIRGGYVASDWTLAGHVAFDYINFESFNWGDEGAHRIRLGLDGQYLLSSDWNLVAGAEYAGLTDSGLDHAGTWTGTFGVNYNIDATKFVGAYVGREMFNSVADGWDFADGFSWGVKFGIDF
jgi:hypothetical protein